ncbi:uncharacterized protein LOC142589058 isoform X2 [Dermacentor variabilis]
MLKQDSYNLMHQYNMSGKWYKESFTASLYPQKGRYDGPIMTVYEGWLSSETFTLVFWNSTEHCSIFAVDRGLCNMLIWSEYIDKQVPQCDSFYGKYCGHQKYAIYSTTCLPASRRL